MVTCILNKMLVFCKIVKENMYNKCKISARSYWLTEKKGDINYSKLNVLTVCIKFVIVKVTSCSDWIRRKQFKDWNLFKPRPKVIQINLEAEEHQL
jgi:hypothetical protein